MPGTGYVDPGATTGDGQPIVPRSDVEPVMTIGGGEAAEAATAELDEDPTKAELYAEAKEQDIEGRSTMSKKELAKALKDA